MPVRRRRCQANWPQKAIRPAAVTFRSESDAALPEAKAKPLRPKHPLSGKQTAAYFVPPDSICWPPEAHLPVVTPNLTSAMNIRNRIQELVWVQARELQPHPRNWRTHPQQQRRVLAGVLQEIGYADALLARRLPDGKLQLLDGHLRAELTPEQTVPVLVLDLNEEEADKLLAVLDPISALAGRDEEKLQQLLQNVQTQDQAVASLLEELGQSATPAEPEPASQVHLPELYQVLVQCRDEEDQRQLYERLQQEGYSCRVLTL